MKAIALVAALCALAACGRRSPPISSPFVRPAWDETVREATVEEARAIDRAAKLRRQGRNREAAVAIDEALAKGLDHPRLFTIRADMALERDRFQEAAAWLEQAIAAGPGLVEPRVLLVNCYLTLERPVAAERVCTEIDQLFPEHPAGPYGKGLCRLRLEDADAARAHLDEALERDGDYPPALQARAAVAGLDGDRRLQERLLQRYVSLVHDDARALATLGRLAEDRGLNKEAERYYRKSWKLRPSGIVAGKLADLARLRRDEAEERFWRSRATGNSP